MRLLRLVATADDLRLVDVVFDLLRDAFPHLPLANADARRTVIAGAVRVNNRVVTRPATPVRRGARVAVAADPSKLARARRRQVDNCVVIYQDAHVVAVDKPAGLPTHATADRQRPNLVQSLARQLRVAEPSLGVHQRLDAGTSGVVIFGLTAVANRGLAAAFERREVDKVYLAVVDARARRDFTVGHAWVSRAPLRAGGAGRRGRRTEAAESGQAAETAFIVRARHGQMAVIEARPLTGRQHQIRAHLAGEKAPILGDLRYGGPQAGRLHLHAWRIRLPHPVSGVPLDVEAPAPENWIEGRFS
jgi:23S rRNA pseudouridine1911/1915/1917 synthase